MNALAVLFITFVATVFVGLGLLDLGDGYGPTWAFVSLFLALISYAMVMFHRQ